MQYLGIVISLRLELYSFSKISSLVQGNIIRNGEWEVFFFPLHSFDELLLSKLVVTYFDHLCWLDLTIYLLQRRGGGSCGNNDGNGNRSSGDSMS